jgi:hypothetical protein
MARAIWPLALIVALVLPLMAGMVEAALKTAVIDVQGMICSG